MKGTRLAIPIAVAAVVLIGIGAYAYMGYRAGPGSMGDGMPENPALVGTLVENAPGRIVVDLSSGKRKAFTVSTSTQVITQVKTGEVGKQLAEFPQGVQVIVQPHERGSSALDSIALMPTALTDAKNPLGTPVAYAGIIASATAGSLVVKDAAGNEAKVRLVSDTLVLANVLAGQSGKTLEDLQPGAYVQVSGYTTRAGIVAGSVQVLGSLQ